MTLKEQVTFDRDGDYVRSWDDYPVLKFSEAPQVEVTLMARADLPPVGAGEGASGRRRPPSRMQSLPRWARACATCRSRASA